MVEERSMIINISRTKTRALCRRKSFTNYHRRLTSPGRSMNLVDGSAFHAGVARGLATKNWDHNPLASTEVPCECAHCAAEEQFAKDRAEITILPELEYQLDDHRAMIDVMIDVYGDAFRDQGIQVIQPECEFDVALPNTHHNCIWLHHIELQKPSAAGDAGQTAVYEEKWGAPDPQAVLEGRIASPHQMEMGMDCACWQPHRFVGKTDAVVVWNQMIWLLEHKTTAISGEQFWSQWRLDIQPTGYIYGIKKALGVNVGGFILNAINKPSESQVSNWNKKRKNGPPKEVKDYITYEREPFLRSQEDLDRFEKEIIGVCDDWERDIIRGHFPLDGAYNKGCNQYNRQCEFHAACVTHDAESELVILEPARRDYVVEKMEALAAKETTK